MKTVVVTAYDVNPLKGSESGMGWNFLLQISHYNKVLAVTRKNNRKDIEKYIGEYAIDTSNLLFYYYDLPKWMRFWKRGQRGSSVYFYLWQLFMPIFIKKNKLHFDLVHNLNFHTDWVPTMLWTFGKPLIWGPIGHHHKIPREYILRVYGVKSFAKDRSIWWIKKLFWNYDLLLKISKKRASIILCMNSSVNDVLCLDDAKSKIFPSVGSEKVSVGPALVSDGFFRVLSIGRFVPLKGFDIVIQSFAHFWKNLDETERSKVTLEIVGKGPQAIKLKQICKQNGIEKVVKFVEWVDRKDLSDIYKCSSVFFFASHEGAGMVVSEAMSYGLPIICFDNFGPGEFVNESCGVKIKYSTYDKSVHEFSEALMQLYRNPNKRKILSMGAKKQFLDKFEWDEKGRRLGKIYNEIFS